MQFYCIFVTNNIFFCITHDVQYYSIYMYVCVEEKSHTRHHVYTTQIEDIWQAQTCPVTSEMWYPSPPPDAIPIYSGVDRGTPLGVELGEEHAIWRSGKLRYLTSNITAKGLPEEKKKACRRNRVHGVEVRDLPPKHFLHGEQGLYATVNFSKCDIVGEYTGRIVDSNVNGTASVCFMLHCYVIKLQVITLLLWRIRPTPIQYESTHRIAEMR